jgi:cephalosporin-C deacetylase-like acetyl esterase
MTRFCSRLIMAIAFAGASMAAQRGTPIPQQLAFTPYHASGIYDVGETVGWTVAPGTTPPTYAYKWTIRRNNAVVLKQGMLDLSSGNAAIEVVGDQPEMIYVAIEPYASLAAVSGVAAAPAAVTARANVPGAAAMAPFGPANAPGVTPAGPSAPATLAVTALAVASPAASSPVAVPVTQTTAPPAAAGASAYVGGNTGRNNGFYAVGAAVAPTRIPLSTPRPADFDAFWDNQLALQAKVPINAVLTPVQTDVPDVELSLFQLDALGSQTHGYVATPARAGTFPAVMQLQYAGVYALNARADAMRAAQGWLVVNVDSHDKLPSDPSGNIPRAYQAIGNTDREMSYFLDMYLRDSRALDYVQTRPDWDGRTIVLMGGSMGGQQSLALAGLRPDRITAVLVCVPAGADTNGDLHGRKAGYPNWPSMNPDAMRTALYFDTVNFAPHINAPVMAGMGFIDTTSPPAGVWTALNQIPGPVEALPMIESEHDNLTPDKGRACPARTNEILDTIVHGGTFTPKPLAR